MKRRGFLILVVALILACNDAAELVNGGPLRAAATGNSGWRADVDVISRVDLGTLGGASSYAADLNDHGTVIGWSQIASGVDRAFRWTEDAGMEDLGTLPGDEWSRAFRILHNGRILGISGASGDINGTPVVWSHDGSVTALPIPLLPNASFGRPTDFNARGEVVGWDVTVLQHAWIWSEALGKYDITANVPGGSFEGAAIGINASGVVVGTNHAFTCVGPIPECWHGFLWSLRAGYQDLGIPGDDPNTNVTALGLNNRSAVAGWLRLGGFGSLQPYRWNAEDGYELLPTFSSVSTYGYAHALNSRGTAVGASLDPQYNTFLIQAAAWPVDGGIVKLSPGDPFPSVALAINRSGAVAGWSSLNCCGGQNHATLWTLGPGGNETDGGPGGNETDGGPGGNETDGAVHDEPGRASEGAAACLWDTRALLSRRALFDCIAESDRNK